MNIVITRANTDAALPILLCTGSLSIAIRAGSIVTTAEARHVFEADTPIDVPELVPGSDYGLTFSEGGTVEASIIAAGFDQGSIFAGFHVAPFANATERKGGAAGPAINPCSCWDAGFRPACPDPRGMALVDGRFWADIYLLGVSHAAAGTSIYGATIADGIDLPEQVDGSGKVRKLDYPTAASLYAHHGKQLLGAEEFFAAAFGVTELSSRQAEPKVTGEADGVQFVSKWGLTDATGTMWQWGTDGDPDMPRASIFGGGWWYGGSAGSRCAYLDSWPGRSLGSISARGRCDHLKPA